MPMTNGSPLGASAAAASSSRRRRCRCVRAADAVRRSAVAAAAAVVAAAAPSSSSSPPHAASGQRECADVRRSRPTSSPAAGADNPGDASRSPCRVDAKSGLGRGEIGGACTKVHRTRCASARNDLAMQTDQAPRPFRQSSGLDRFVKRNSPNPASIAVDVASWTFYRWRHSVDHVNSTDLSEGSVSTPSTGSTMAEPRDAPYDPFAPEVLDDPFAALSRAPRPQCPVHHHAGFGERGFYTLPATTTSSTCSRTPIAGRPTGARDRSTSRRAGSRATRPSTPRTAASSSGPSPRPGPPQFEPFVRRTADRSRRLPSPSAG